MAGDVRRIPPEERTEGAPTPRIIREEAVATDRIGHVGLRPSSEPLLRPRPSYAVGALARPVCRPPPPADRARGGDPRVGYGVRRQPGSASPRACCFGAETAVCLTPFLELPAGRITGR